MVFMPTVNHLGISRRIARDRERRKLRDFVKKHRPKGAGFIVRTVCAGKPTEALKQDMDYLIESWETIKETKAKKKAPSCIHQEHDLVVRLVETALLPKWTDWFWTTKRSSTKCTALSVGSCPT